MKKVFVIQSALVVRDSYASPLWRNLYVVSSEDVARKDCRDFQISSDNNFATAGFKFIYRYEILDLFYDE